MGKKFIEKLFEFPAKTLQFGVRGAHKIERGVGNSKSLRAAEGYWKKLGPGLTTGAADDDPSGIATYSQTGARYGFQLLWLALFTFPLMAVVQEMCARIGLVTGQGLAANIRHNYPRWVLYITTALLFAANTFNIGADLGAMAQAAQLIMPSLDFATVLIVFTVGTLLVQIFMTYASYAKYLKYLALTLFAYVASALIVNMNWGEVAAGMFIPTITFNKEQIILICGILGTTISPYLFFWQTSQEVEEKILSGTRTNIKHEPVDISSKEINRMRIDVWSGMFISNLVMFAIIATCAATIYANGGANITTAADAAAALRPLAGEHAYTLFALGIIATGLLAVPILAGSISYAMSESFGWKNGLYRKLKEAYAFYGVLIVAMLVGLGMNFIGLDPIKALLYSAVANGLVAPVVLFFIVSMGSNKRVMGNHTNKPFTTFIGWAVVCIMSLAGVAAIVAMLS